MTDYQRKLIIEGAPPCRVCGLRLPARLVERGICDFCLQAGYELDGTYPARWPEQEIGGADARAYEERGPRALVPAPKLTDHYGGVNGEPIHTRDERRANVDAPRLTSGSFWQRVKARAHEQAGKAHE